MNPELREKTQEQITKQRIAVLQEGFRKQLSGSSIVRTTALKFLIKYYFNKFYWHIVGILIGLIIVNIIQIWIDY